MKVLFDWDLPELDMKYCFSRGIKLVLFSFCTFLHLRPKFLEDIYLETDEYAKALIKLNEMLGVETVFGIRDVVSDAKPYMVNYLKDHNQDVRKHIHIGKHGPDRIRTWEPPLTQSMDTWDFEIKYYNGILQPLKDGELPLWHIDRPYRLQTYINFVYEMKNKERVK
jgi:hypothetical protein